MIDLVVEERRNGAEVVMVVFGDSGRGNGLHREEEGWMIRKRGRAGEIIR